MPDAFLHYEALGIAQLLKSRLLEVPFYQRSYSWFTLEERKTAAEPAATTCKWWSSGLT